MRQAVQCEEATGRRCRCRCGGALHGADRLSEDQSPRDLPTEDPHHAEPSRRRRRPVIGEQLSFAEAGG